MQPLISILLPTRARTGILEKSFETLLGKSRHPEQIEVCIAYDDDDQESHEYFTGPRWIEFKSRYKIMDNIHRLPRWGYRDLHLYLNHLAAHARGKWLFFWGDDALMETDHWDDHVRDNEDWVGLLHIVASNAPMNCSILPLFHRQWIELFGCVTPVNPADSWISDICWRAKARKVIPVSVFHDRPEDSGNNRDQTWHDKKAVTDWHTAYYLPESQQMRLDWSKRLREYLNSQ